MKFEPKFKAVTNKTILVKNKNDCSIPCPIINTIDNIKYSVLYKNEIVDFFMVGLNLYPIEDIHAGRWYPDYYDHWDFDYFDSDSDDYYYNFYIGDRRISKYNRKNKGKKFYKQKEF